MKVLMTTDTIGGVWTYALELADALAERGVEVTLAAMGGPLRRDQRAELRHRLYAEPYALEWMEEPWADVERAGAWLLRIAREVEPDLVHLNGFVHAALPWDVPVLVVGHSDVLSWHEAVRGTPAGPEWTRYRDAVAAGLARADLLVAPTRAMLDALVRLYVPECPRLVIPNGRRSPRPLRIEKEPFVLSAGRLWDEAKNVQALTRVAPELPWPLTLVGDGSPAGRVSRPRLDGLLARASIFALPARYEPFGLGPLEAGLSGCALVLGDIPSLREVWGDAALFVDPGDEAALAAALRRLIADGARRAELAAGARQRAAEYSPQRMADTYLGAYERVLEPEARAA